MDPAHHRRSVERTGTRPCPGKATAARGPTVPDPQPQPRTPSNDISPPDASITGVPYAELHCHSAFSCLLDGASTPEFLVAEALRLGSMPLPSPTMTVSTASSVSPRLLPTRRCARSTGPNYRWITEPADGLCGSGR